MMTQEKQILFNAAMVRSVLSGDKIHTRRVVIPQPCGHKSFVCADYCGRPDTWLPTGSFTEENPSRVYKCPYGSVGDELWVRENVRAIEVSGGGDFVEYIADGEIQQIWSTEESSENWIKLYNYSNGRGKTVPSIHMPRWASRIQLRITDIRIERLHKISNQGAINEGVTGRLNRFCMDWSQDEHYIANDTPVGAFAAYWEKMSGKDSWKENPFVWVIAFERIKP